MVEAEEEEKKIMSNRLYGAPAASVEIGILMLRRRPGTLWDDVLHGRVPGHQGIHAAVVYGYARAVQIEGVKRAYLVHSKADAFLKQRGL